MKVMNNGAGLKHIGTVTIAPGETGDVDDNWASSIGGDMVIITPAEKESEDSPAARRGRPAKQKEAE